MARNLKPPPGRLIVSIIYSSMDALAECVSALERKFGRVQYETLEINCEQADKYREEMGDHLSRRFYSFEKIVPRDYLPHAKNICHKIEPQFSDTVDGFHFRTVNIDPGLLSPTTLVMGTHREKSHRVYLKDGVYGEVTMIHAHGNFCRLPWTESDYCDNEAIEFFDRVKATYETVEAIEESITR